MATYEELEKRAVKKGLELGWETGRNGVGGYYKIYVLARIRTGKNVATTWSLKEMEKKIAKMTR